MKIKISVSSVIYTVLISLVLSIVPFLYLSFQINKGFELKSKTLEKNYIDSQKLLVRQEVKRVIDRIYIFRNEFHRNARTGLKTQVEAVASILDFRDKNFNSNEEFVSNNKEILKNFIWSQSTGYFYLLKRDGTIVYHGGFENLINKNVFEIFKSDEDAVKFFNGAFKNGVNIGEYNCFKPGDSMRLDFRKIGYLKSIKGTDLYVGAGIYIDEVEDEIKNHVLNFMINERYGHDNYGYFWIHDTDYNLILHPISSELINTNLFDLKTADGKYIFRIINNALNDSDEVFLDYNWIKPAGKNPEIKVSYVKKIPEWNWYIGSGFYLSDHAEYISSEKKVISDVFDESIIKLAYLIAVLFLVSLVISYWFFRVLRSMETAQLKNYTMLEQYKQILDESTIVSRTKPNGVISYVNDRFSKITGYSREELVGKSHSIVRHPLTPKSVFFDLWSTIKSGQIYRGIIKNKRKDKTNYYISATILPIKNENGDVVEYISSAHDVTELIENRSKLENFFNTDALTGLGSRVKLMQDLENQLNGTLCLADIDSFREINDMYGDKIGDQILKLFANQFYRVEGLKDCTFYRINADTFAILSTSLDVEILIPAVKEVSILLVESVKKNIDNNIFLNVTNGFSSGNSNLYALADIALQTAKNRGISFYEYNSDDMDIEAGLRENINTIKMLNEALSDDRVVPAFQPLYNVEHKTITKYECLVRVIDDAGNVISPFVFLDIAKKTRLYTKLTLKMIEKSVNMFKNNKYSFSINLTLEDLLNDETMEFLYTYAYNAGVMNRLTIEIVETEELKNFDLANEVFSKFKEAGATISIDDFGSGYSNFEYLISLKADFVKIDSSIIKKILDDDRARQIVKSIVDFASRSGMKTVAEFISSKEIADMAIEIGVDYLQGYYIGKPEFELVEQ